MDAALNQFYQHLIVERGLAPLTVSAYARDLQDFWNFLETRGRTDWVAVDLADLQAYFAAQEARGLSARSRARSPASRPRTSSSTASVCSPRSGGGWRYVTGVSENLMGLPISRASPPNSR